MNSFLWSEKCLCACVGLHGSFWGGHSALLAGSCSLCKVLSNFINYFLKFNLLNIAYKMLDNLLLVFLCSLVLHHTSFFAPRTPTFCSLCCCQSELFIIPSHGTVISAAYRPLHILKTLSSTFLLADFYCSFCSQHRCQLFS